jgi:chaperonin cofactor prefoldin
MAVENTPTDFDFGFTIVDEDELTIVTELQAEKEKVERKVTLSSSEKEKLDNKINTLYNMFQPLLNNLALNPEKDYILWPNRLEKIEEFRDKIDAVYKG